MNKIIVALFFITFQIQLHGQQKFDVTFEMIITANEDKLLQHITGDREVKDALLKKITESKSFVLHIDGVLSNFLEVEKIQNYLPSGDEIQIEFLGENKMFIHKNLDDKIIYEEVYLDRKYLVTDSLVTYDWKITKDNKEIQGLNVYKAMATTPDKRFGVIAWYCPKLNTSHGPEKYWGLPGTILELTIFHLDQNSVYESIQFITTEINLSSEEKVLLPKRSKRISKSEYNKLLKSRKSHHLELTEGVDKD